MQFTGTGLVQKPMSLQFLQAIQKLLGWDTSLVRQVRCDLSPPRGPIHCGCHLSLPLWGHEDLHLSWAVSYGSLNDRERGIQGENPSLFYESELPRTQLMQGCSSLKIAVPGSPWHPYLWSCPASDPPLHSCQEDLSVASFWWYQCLEAPRTLSHLGQVFKTMVLVWASAFPAITSLGFPRVLPLWVSSSFLNIPDIFMPQCLCSCFLEFPLPWYPLKWLLFILTNFHI